MRKVLGFYAPEQENGYLSNWYPCAFRYGKHVYASAEQFMMAQKAALFRDQDVLGRILAASDLGEIKKLGRQVAHYDDALWSRLRGPMMRRGLRAKFQQNQALLEMLLNTGSLVLAECAPYDLVWGIGLTADDPRIQDIQSWRGQNLLGRTLMDVRTDLRGWLAASPEIGYTDAAALPANELWAMPLAAIRRLPRFSEAVSLYDEVLRHHLPEDDRFHPDRFTGSLAELEAALRTDPDSGLPDAWFWEMKQDLADLLRFGGI